MLTLLIHRVNIIFNIHISKNLLYYNLETLYAKRRTYSAALVLTVLWLIPKSASTNSL